MTRNPWGHFAACVLLLAAYTLCLVLA